MEQPQSDELGVFVARALPRSRAWLSLIFLGTSLLAMGGSIEFSTGSPMTEGQGVASYWAVLFAFHAVAFGGSSLIGAFPALAVRGVKVIWIAVVVLLYVWAFAVWRSHPSAGGFSDWLRLAPPYLPALVPLLAGCIWRNHALVDADSVTKG